MNKSETYNKKIYTFKLLINDLAFLFVNTRQIIATMRDKKISKAFFEKIMTVVTAVNGCVYCTWFHAKQSLANGISAEEMKNMLQLQFHSDASEFELLGLLYAQHFAETDRKPDNEMTDKLIEYYGDNTAKHIIIIIRMIFFGNLSGNTFDAFLSRFKGKKAPESNIIFEFLFFVINIPFLLPLMPFVKKYRKFS